MGLLYVEHPEAPDDALVEAYAEYGIRAPDRRDPWFAYEYPSYALGPIRDELRATAKDICFNITEAVDLLQGEELQQVIQHEVQQAVLRTVYTLENWTNMEDETRTPIWGITEQLFKDINT